ncbi:MAG: hypothetical protein HY289_15605 [Planctomycetes bacterium]|nr:hypothetical protein [Planctomycetota bacterium]
MAKPPSSMAKLTRLAALHDVPMTPALSAELRGFLRDGSNLVIAEAAALAAQGNAKELLPDLAAAFERLMVDAEKSDPHCRGKIAVVEALNELEYSESDLLLRGLTHVQNPRWDDPTQDAAGPLRAHCALGLARLNIPGLIVLLTDRLLDPDNAARVGVVRAFSGVGSSAAVPILRYKAMIGDRAEEVMSECFASLLSLAPVESVSFVARFLKSGDQDVQGAAVFALAETRRPDACQILQDFWPLAPTDLHESVLLAMAMMRLSAAFDFLVQLIARKDRAARSAVSALAHHRYNDKLCKSVGAAVEANGDPAVVQWFAKKFSATEANPSSDDASS